MRTVFRRAALLAAPIVLLAACTLPNRDNGNDPQIRPTARLSVESAEYVLAEETSPACAAADENAASFSRGRCLVLDATASSDPQGAADLKGFVFEYQLAGTGGTLSTTNSWFALGSSGTGILTVAPPILRQLPDRRDLWTRVRVRDGGGHEDTDEQRLFLENSPPIAIEPGLRHLPFFGAAWRSPGAGFEPLTVRLHGRDDSDPDGDPLTYCWSFDGRRSTFTQAEILAVAVPDAQCSPDPDLVLELPSYLAGVTPRWGVLAFKHWVLDGIDGATALRSDDVVATVMLERRPFWAADASLESALLMDLERVRFVGPDGMSGIPAMVFDTSGNPNLTRVYYPYAPPPGGSVNRLRFTTADRLFLFIKELDLNLAFGVPAEIVGAYADKKNNNLWLTLRTITPHLAVYVTDLDDPKMPSSTSPPNYIVPVGDLLGGIALLTDESPFAAIDGQGRFWTGAMNGDRAVALRATRPSGVLTVSQVDSRLVGAGRLLTGLAIRVIGHVNDDNITEAWIVRSKDVLNGGMGVTTADVEVVDPAGMSRLVDFEESVQVAHGLEFYGGAFAWSNFVGIGLASLEVEPVAQEILLTNHVIEEAPSGRVLEVSPLTGLCRMISAGGHYFTRASPDGSASVVETASGLKAFLGVEKSGQVWSFFEDSEGRRALTRGAGSGEEGIVVRTQTPQSLGIPVVDYSSGDLWTPTIFPPGARRLYPDGRLADSFSRTVDLSNPTPVVLQTILPASVLAVDPSSGLLWYGAGGGAGSGGASKIFLFDPYKKRSIARDVIEPAGLRPLVANLVGKEVMAMAVQPSLDSNLLMMTRVPDASSTRYDYFLERMAQAGPPMLASVPLSQPTISTPREFPLMARDVFNGTVCVANLQDVDSLRIRRFAPDLSTVDSDVTVTVDLNTEGLRAITAIRGQCYVGWEEVSASRIVMTDGAGAHFMSPGSNVPGLRSIVPLLTYAELTNVLLPPPQRLLVGGGSSSLTNLYINYGTMQLVLSTADTIAIPSDVRLLTP